MTGSSQRMAVRSKPATSRAVEGMTTRRPGQCAQIVADLHHGGPDIVEELNFSHGLETARGHANAAANDGSFRKRRVKDSIISVLSLQAGSGFENAALPFQLLQCLIAAGVGDVFTEDGDAFVAGHLVGERGSDHFDHGFWSAVQLRLRIKGS